MYSFTISQDVPVRDLKPAAIKVYDYYQPGGLRCDVCQTAGSLARETFAGRSHSFLFKCSHSSFELHVCEIQ